MRYCDTLRERKKHRFLRGRDSRGQVLILGIVALLIIVVGILILFDVQRIIRGKAKTIAAIDAAALTGANWQKHSLNLIGELNLVKACTVLISDPAYGLSGDSDKFLKVEKDENGNITPESLQRAKQEFAALEAASDNLTQMQLRISFVGPLVGFGAAQQTAKNNGLTANEDCIQFIDQLMKYVADEDFYTKDEFLKQEYFGYSWRIPYLTMLGELRQGGKGIAVGTNVDLVGLPRLYTDPPTKPDYIQYIQSRFIIDSILGMDWCIIMALVDADWTDQWWGHIVTDRQNQKLMNGSEILNLDVEFLPPRKQDDEIGRNFYSSNRASADELVSPGGLADRQITELAGKEGKKKIVDAYNQVDPVDSAGNAVEDADMKFNPLPALTWAVFGSKWQPYDDVKELEQSFRAPFREGAAYTSGALSYFSVHVPVTTLTGKFDFSRNLSFGTRSGGGRAMSKYMERARKGMRKSRNTSPISFDAVAKPFGLLSVESGGKRPPFAARLVLPVFDTVTLVPVSLECPAGLPMHDYGWVIYITKYLPALGQSASLDEALSKLPPEEAILASPFVEALRRLDDPSFRERGRTWLDMEATGHNDQNRDHCNDWPGGGAVAGGGLDPCS